MKSLTKRMTVLILGMGIVEQLLLLVVWGLEKSWGPIFGSLGAILALFSLKRDIEVMVARRSKKGWLAGYFGRYAIYAIFLLTGALVSLEILIGVFIGLMNLKFSSFLMWRWLD